MMEQFQGRMQGGNYSIIYYLNVCIVTKELGFETPGGVIG